jgi:hypothetical protein
VQCRHHRGAAAPWVPWARAAQGGSSPAADNESTMHILMMLAVCLRLGEVSAAPVSPPDHEAANGLAAFEFHHTSTHRSGLTGPALRRHATQPQLAPQLLAPLFVLRRTVVGRKRVHRVKNHPAPGSVRSLRPPPRPACWCRPRIAQHRGPVEGLGWGLDGRCASQLFRIAAGLRHWRQDAAGSPPIARTSCVGLDWKLASSLLHPRTRERRGAA